MASVWGELKRRNVVKVAVAYAIVGWLLVQVADTFFPALQLPGWTVTFVAGLVILGFPLALILSWAYELTPDGMERTKSVSMLESITHVTGRKLDFAIIGLLVIALGLVAVDQYVLEEGTRQAEVGPALVDDAPLPLPERPSVAVLPFANDSADESQEYFVNGLTDDLITDLGKLSGLFVIGRASSFSFKDAPVRIETIAETLGVRYIIDGSVRRAGDQIRVNARLVEGSTGEQLWAERYDEQLTDLFAVQDRLVARIVSSLAIELTQSEEAQLVHEPTAEFRAYDLYYQARNSFFGGDEAGLRRSLELYEESSSIDPGFARAYTGYARASADIWRQSSPRVRANALALAGAREAAARALGLDPTLAEAHSVLALLSMGDGDHASAVQSARRAVQLDPNGVDAYTVLAIVLGYAGEPEAALEAIQTAVRLDPQPLPYILNYYGWALFLNRRYEDAVAVLEPIAGSQDRRLILGEAPRALLAASYAAVGRIEDASAEVEALVQQIPYVNLSHFRLFYQLHARAEDIEHRIDALRRAGMSDWPFGFDGDPEQRLTGTILEDLISGRTWTGTDSTGGSGDGQFNARFDRQGRVAYFSQSTSAIGTAFVRGEELCEQYDLFYWGRPSCGPVYRNLEGTVEDRNEYVYVNAGMVRYFSTPE